MPTHFWLCLAAIYCDPIFARDLTGDKIHDALRPNELFHIFGVRNASNVPDYALDYPTATVTNDGHFYTIKLLGELYRFELSDNSAILSRGFHAVDSGSTARNVSVSAASSHCLYTGRAITHNNTRVSLTGCGQNAHALISTHDGQHFLVQPLANLRLADGPRAAHVIHRRSTRWLTVNDAHVEQPTDAKTCLFDARDDPFPTEGDSERRLGELSFSHDRAAVLRGPLTIELAVFADDAMWRHFTDLYGAAADEELQRFVLAAANNIHHLFSHETIDPKIQLKIVRYEVMKSPPQNRLRERAHRSGEVDLLLEAFCEYQSQINPSSDGNPRHWDHALLFSGYDLYRGGLQSVAGYAPVKGMCSRMRSCTINEGLDFGSVFVITHEMGHSLGMYHDGDNGCDSRCCIMSPSVGSGKTKWSSCSIGEFNDFAFKLGRGLQSHNCLTDDEDRGAVLLDHGEQGLLPGQRYSLDQQCRIFHGDCWAHELRDGQELEDVCSMVWCGAGEGIIRTSHPALEGTYCGPRKWCVQGACIDWTNVRPRVVHGSWAAWNDQPSASCGEGCSTCQIDGQLRIRKSIRLCENPPPNNGGKQCPGSSLRGIVCSSERCKGPLPEQFATNICHNLRSDPAAPDLLLSGRGFQYEQSPCAIWCHMKLNSFIRTVGNFPDGTPCGTDRFCVKGLCQQLACNDEAVVESSRNDCPVAEVISNVESSRNNRGSWSKWSSWSRCSRTCGSGGVRQRTRACRGGRSCGGSSVERETCGQDPCNGWSSWGVWADCDVSCGDGRRSRSRECRGDSCVGPYAQLSQCSSAVECPRVNVWSPWGTWGSCTTTCGGGLQLRKRDCLSRVCTGRGSLSRRCNSQLCTTSASDAVWGSWASWSACSQTCDEATRNRRRECVGVGTCLGSSVQFAACEHTWPCLARDLGHVSPSASWSGWSAWSSCSQSCGDGFQRRTRGCKAGGDCKGASTENRQCTRRPCDAGGASGAGVWAAWGEWRSCTCRSSEQRRYRRCEAEPPCRGQWVDRRRCSSPVPC